MRLWHKHISWKLPHPINIVTWGKYVDRTWGLATLFEPAPLFWGSVPTQNFCRELLFVYSKHLLIVPLLCRRESFRHCFIIHWIYADNSSHISGGFISSATDFSTELARFSRRRSSHIIMAIDVLSYLWYNSVSARINRKYDRRLSECEQYTKNTWLQRSEHSCTRQ